MLLKERSQIRFRIDSAKVCQLLILVFVLKEHHLIIQEHLLTMQKGIPKLVKVA